MYRPLCNTWTRYDPVWWNTLDFAIRQAWLLADYGDKRRELKDLYKDLIKQRFWGAIQTIFGSDIISVWLHAYSHAAILAIVAALGTGVGGVFWPLAWSINWKALANLIHGLRFEWDEAAKEVESAIPQLHGLVDE